jgi:hypothetical protein
MNFQSLEKQLDSFDPQKRLEALKTLAATGPAPAATGENVNMHIHTFFSYNAEGWSPSHVAWGCRQKGVILLHELMIVRDCIRKFDQKCNLGELSQFSSDFITNILE